MVYYCCYIHFIHGISFQPPPPPPTKKPPLIMSFFNFVFCHYRKGEACNHVAAVLFALDDFVSEGLNNVPDDVTCTDRLKKWNKPAERVIQAKTVADIKVHK